MRTKKQILSFLMAVMLLLSTSVSSVMAADGQENTSINPVWEVNLQQTENGSVSLYNEKTAYLAGETVTLVSHPEDGYTTESLKVIGKTTGSEITVTLERNQYMFQMPNENVTVTGVFKAISKKTNSEKLKEETISTQENLEMSNPSKEENTTSHNIIIKNTEQYTITVNKELATEGEEVKIKTQGNIARIDVVTRDKERIAVSSSEEGYSFTMPNQDVYVLGEVGNTLKTAMARAGNVSTVTVWDFRFNYQAPVSYFEVRGVDNKSHVAFCSEHEKKPPQVGWGMTTVETYDGYNKKNENLRKVLWYGYGGPGNIGANYAETSLGTSVANGHMDTDDTGETEGPIGKTFLNRVKGMASPPASFTVYKIRNLEDKDKQYQDLVYWIYNPEGYAKLKKESSNPDITEGNSCYSLAGARYGVYKNVACTDKDKVGELTTNASGESNTLKLNAGTYYVKELEAPKGFVLDRKTYPVKVESEKTTTVPVKDLPQNDPVNMLLGKYDGEKTYVGEGNLPQGSASLEGAEFEVKFYGGMYDSVEDLEKVAPKKSWIFRTNKNGVALFEEGFLVSGDEFYRDSSGNITLPLGTITIQEIKAPKGYNLSDEIFLRQIDSSGSAEDVNTYNMPEIPEDVIRGDLEIIKVYQPEDEEEDTLQGIKGVEFTITSKTTGKEVMKIVTDEKGKATTASKEQPRGSLPFDTYIVEETKTPEGYNPIKPFEVTIKEEAVTITGIYKQDTLITSPIQVVKVDKSTGKTIPVKGATFQLLDKNKEVITMTTHYPNTQVLDRFTTDENGQFVFPEKLKYGTYYLREIQAPDGYLLNGQELPFTVTKDAGWENPIVVKFEDENAMGKIELSKFEEGFSNQLKGAVFEIRAAEDIVTPDGTIRLKKGDLADTLTTTGLNPVQSKALFLGKYILKEIKQADGFILSDKEYPVTLKYKDQVTPIVIESTTIYNQPTTLQLEKYRKGEPQVSLAGVKFQVWNEKTPDQKKTYITDDNGMITIKYLLPDSTYCIQEIETLPGYVLDNTIHKVSVNKEGYVEGEQLYTLRLENDYTKYDFTKSDLTTDKELPGAKMEVREKETGKLIDAWTSDKEPHRITDLVVGKTYILSEITAPNGYLVAQDIEFTVPSTGEIQKVEMKDDVVVGQIRIHKTDADSGNGITGAVFEIRAAEDIITADGTIRLKKGKLADTITTKNGEAISKKLFLGKYTVKEVRQVPGYVLDTTPVEVELIYENQVTPVVYADLSKENLVTKLRIEKYEKGNTEQRLEGIEFSFWMQEEEDPIDPGFSVTPNPDALYPEEIDPDYTLETTTLVTDENGEILLTHLLPNTTYYFQETKTLPGYVLDDTIHKVYISMDGTIMGQDVFTYQIENDYTKLYISKTDIATGEELPGAKMKLEKIEEDGEKTLIRKWTSSKEPEYFEKLIPGEYCLTELSAPKGFKVAEAITFTVKETGEIQKVEMKDEHKEGTIRTSTPTDFRNGAARTGDTEDLFLYLIICLFTAGIIMSALWVKLAITEKTEMAERNKKDEE